MCYNGIVYDRRVKGKTLTLAVSGMLWEHSLVLVDKETRSLWSQLLGEAMRGKLTGTILKSFPSVMTDWKSWRKRYPRSTVAVMSRTAQEYRGKQHASDELLLIGLVLDGRARAWKLETLRNHPVVNDRLDNVGILIVRDTTNGTMVLYGRKVDQRDLSFDWKDGKLIDRGTGSEWDLITGQAINGTLKGRRLPSLPGIVSYYHAWEIFHPKSTYWQP